METLTDAQKKSLKSILDKNAILQSSAFFIKAFEYVNSVPRIEGENFDRLPYYYESLLGKLDTLEITSQLIDKFDLKENKLQKIFGVLGGALEIFGAGAIVSKASGLVGNKREKKYKQIAKSLGNIGEKSGVNDIKTFKKILALLLTLKSSEVLQSFTPKKGIGKSVESKISELVNKDYGIIKKIFSAGTTKPESKRIFDSVEKLKGVDGISFFASEVVAIEKKNTSDSIRQRQTEKKLIKSGREKRKEEGKFVPEITRLESDIHSNDIEKIYLGIASKKEKGIVLTDLEKEFLQNANNEIDKFVSNEKALQLKKELEKARQELEKVKEKQNINTTLFRKNLEDGLKLLDQGFEVYRETDKKGDEIFKIVNKKNPDQIQKLQQQLSLHEGIESESISIKKDNVGLLQAIIDFILSLFGVKKKVGENLILSNLSTENKIEIMKNLSKDERQKREEYLQKSKEKERE